MSKVSVIVPVYNAEKYLGEAIESVLNQTYTDFELLLINDRSTDNSKAICEEYALKDNRIVLLENDTESHGPGPTRNIGLDSATGDYIYFMDADDWIDKSLLQCAVDRMRETEADIVQVGVEYEWNDGNNTSVQCWKGRDVLTRDDIINDAVYFFSESSNSLWRHFFKCETVKEVRFEDILNGEDVCYVSDALRNSERIAYIQKALYHHRLIKGSTCHRWVKDTIRCLNIQWEHQIKLLKSYDGKIDEMTYSVIVYGDYMWAVYQLSSPFCPLSYREKKIELLTFERQTEFNKYRNAYPLKLQHGVMKIEYILVKYHMQGLLLFLRPILLKLLRRE